MKKPYVNTSKHSEHPEMRCRALVDTYATYPFTLARASGAYVYDTEGKAYLDMYGGHCVCATGHCHPYVVESVRRQMETLFFYSNAAPIEIRERAAERLLDFAGSGMAGVFFCNSGSEANENALKMAVLATGRKRFVAFHGSFHGRTLLALSVTDSEKLRAPFQPMLADVQFLPLNDVQALEMLDLSGTAAVILEPVQSMAGVRAADAEWIRLLRAKCTEAGTLLIFDEVQTGMGRLGAPFAAKYFGVDPDMITVAKGMASGYPMGAVLFNQSLVDGIKIGDLGSTFGGGPVACAALVATLEVIEQEGLIERAAKCGAVIAKRLQGGLVREITGAGLLLGLQVGSSAAALKEHLLRHGVLVGASNDPSVLRLMPPLTIPDSALDKLFEAVASFEDKSAGSASDSLTDKGDKQ